MLSTVACMVAPDGNKNRALLGRCKCLLADSELAALIAHYLFTCTSLRKPAGIKHVIIPPCACSLRDSPNAPARLWGQADPPWSEAQAPTLSPWPAPATRPALLLP